MENALGGQVAVDLHAPQQPPDGIEHGPRRSLKDARCWKIHLQLFAEAPFDSTRQFSPAFCEVRGFRRMTSETPDKCLEGPVFPGLLRCETGDLFESRIHRANVVLGVEEHD